MHLWKTTLHLRQRGLYLLVTDLAGDVLKARLPARTGDPRALLTLCEGLALWQGSPLNAALCVADNAPRSLVEALFEDNWPAESPLVHYSHVNETHPANPRMYRIRGFGDFRKTYLLDSRRH